MLGNSPAKRPGERTHGGLGRRQELADQLIRRVVKRVQRLGDRRRTGVLGRATEVGLRGLEFGPERGECLVEGVLNALEIERGRLRLRREQVRERRGGAPLAQNQALLQPLDRIRSKSLSPSHRSRISSAPFRPHRQTTGPRVALQISRFNSADLPLR